MDQEQEKREMLMAEIGPEVAGWTQEQIEAGMRARRDAAIEAILATRTTRTKDTSRAHSRGRDKGLSR